MVPQIVWPASLTHRLSEVVPYCSTLTIMHQLLMAPSGPWVRHPTSKTIAICSAVTQPLPPIISMMRSVTPNCREVHRGKVSTRPIFHSARITITPCCSSRAIYRILLRMALIASWRRIRRTTRRWWATSTTRVNPKMPLWSASQSEIIHRWVGFRFLHMGQWGSLSNAAKMGKGHNQTMQIIRVT